jgi:hypothetical protein
MNYIYSAFFSTCTYLGIDVKYLSTIPVNELNEIDDIARKAMHLRRIIHRIQACLRAVDKVNKDMRIFLRIFIL